MLFKTEKLADPESRNRPGILFRSTSCLMALKISGHFWASSMVRGLSRRIKPSGSDFAASCPEQRGFEGKDVDFGVASQNGEQQRGSAVSAADDEGASTHGSTQDGPVEPPPSVGPQFLKYRFWLSLDVEQGLHASPSFLKIVAAVGH